jgi:hypothetical protein
MPLVTPALSALAIFTFLSNWTAFIWPLIVTTSKELYTLPVGLASFAVESQIQWELIMTGAALATIPTLDRLPAAAALYRPRRRARRAEGMTSMTATHRSAHRATRSVFPDPVYKETVLRPLFDAVKTHHVAGFRAIDRAHLVMLAETGILSRETAVQHRPRAERDRREIDPATLSYTGERRGLFLPGRGRAAQRLKADDAMAACIPAARVTISSTPCSSWR